MHYDDEARQFNFLSGLTFGAILGAGLALLLAPGRRGRGPLRPGRRPDWKNRAAETLERVGSGVAESLPEGLARGRRRRRR